MSIHRPMFHERTGEAESERRLRARLNDSFGEVLQALDAAIQMRTAPQDAQKARHQVRAKLIEAGCLAMHALTVPPDR